MDLKKMASTMNAVSELLTVDTTKDVIEHLSGHCVESAMNRVCKTFMLGEPNNLKRMENEFKWFVSLNYTNKELTAPKPIARHTIATFQFEILTHLTMLYLNFLYSSPDFDMQSAFSVFKKELSDLQIVMSILAKFVVEMPNYAKKPGDQFMFFSGQTPFPERVSLDADEKKFIDSLKIVYNI